MEVIFKYLDSINFVTNCKTGRHQLVWKMKRKKSIKIEKEICLIEFSVWNFVKFNIIIIKYYFFFIVVSAAAIQMLLK